MNTIKIIITTLLTLILVSCGEPVADVSKPASYNKDGISFSYPGNWKVTEDEQTEDVRYIFVETPGDAIVIMQIYPQDDASELQEYAEWFAAISKEETPIAVRDDSQFSAVSFKTNNGNLTGVRENFSIKLAGVSIPHRTDYYRINDNKNAAFLISQSASEDLEKVKPGFDLINKTFKFN